MPRVLVAGGGLAGLAAATALAQSGCDVELAEARPFLGGRASSYPHQDETIDNCQHVLLRCCVNLLDLYARLGVADKVRFYREFFFIEPGGRMSVMKAGVLPAPLHFTGSFARLRFLGLADKAAIARAMLAIRRGTAPRTTMGEWLRGMRQTARAVSRFWGPVLVSAINEDLDRMAAEHGFQVFREGFLAGSGAHEMGVPAVPLSDLYARAPGVRIHYRTTATGVIEDSGRAAAVDCSGIPLAADAFVLAVPFERAGALVPGLRFDGWEHSPITGVHLWFDRPVTSLPHAALLDRTIQWFFNKSEGRYLQLVISASRSVLDTPRAEIIRMAVDELAEFLPVVRGVQVVKAHVVKEVRATFSAVPGLVRPGCESRWPNVFLAGDWTNSGWPATMEGAVRSGYIAAEAVSRYLGRPARFLK
ncbi:MAG: FAD-dependent oxidoreductase [Acidobacteria bacterium]|nr:FAD-dependent oxidoreductase [Acidobacteriota bacterium]